MHLLVDAQCLQSPESGTRGIGRYARSLLNALAAARPSWRIEAAENARFPAIDRAMLDPGLVISSFEPLLDVSPSSRAANDRFFGEWLCARRPDAILELNFFEEQMVVPTFSHARPPLCAVVYDLIPILFHGRYLSTPERVDWYAQRLRQFAASDHALAISDATRNDVLRLLRWPSEKITTILGAPEERVVRMEDRHAEDAMLRSFGIDRPFVLCVAGVDERKNVRGIVTAFAGLPPDLREGHQLVIVCALSAVQRQQWEEDVRSLGLTDQVCLTNYVPDDVLQSLYARCRASVFASFYEGLGLPVLEAIRAGAPVVASNRSSIPEFADPSTVLVDPGSTGALTSALADVLRAGPDDHQQARRQFAAQFSWSRTAAAAAVAIESMRRPRRPGDGRLRLAWVSPLPPTRSGIADYSRELLQHLPAQRLDLELVVSAQAVPDPELAAGYRVLHEHEIDERHADDPFDLFVYHVGNSPLHLYMLELMQRHPGLVVLHDLFLGGLALRAAEVGAWPNLGGDLEAEGASDLALAVRAGEADHERIAREVPLNRRIVAMSEGVVVHSAWSWRQVRKTATVPVFHIPMGVAQGTPESIAAARARVGCDSDAFVVATLGEVTPSKRVDRILLSLSRLDPTIQRRLAFVIVGNVETSLRETLLAAARDAGLEKRVRLTGRVSLDDLTAWARAADACVQLRYPVRGETSAALLRALAAGAACVVSDADGFGEVPDDVALRVRMPDYELEDLVAALTRLHNDPALAVSLRENAVAFVRRQHSLDEAGRRYAAAIALTASRRRTSDGEWRDAAASGLAQAAAHGTLDDAAIVRWAELHASVRAVASGRP
jgi:glycosyltransferase involved in cell wall biosynthesis